MWEYFVRLCDVTFTFHFVLAYIYLTWHHFFTSWNLSELQQMSSVGSSDSFPGFSLIPVLVRHHSFATKTAPHQGSLGSQWRPGG